jgi:CubicO group peptidase (beta-lactamase class C family)
MKDTAFSVPTEKMDRLAKTYKHGSDGKLIETDPILNVWPQPGRSLASGGGGLFSTIDDYSRLAQMLANNGILSGQRILGRKTVELMSANHLASLPQPAETVNPDKGFGYGVEVVTDLGRGALPASVGQFGWYGAATTYCQIDPRERLVAIAFCQHLPFNEHKFFSKFATGYYQALR